MVKVLAVFLLALLGFVADCPLALASLTIGSVSSTIINSPDDSLTIFASASGLQNTTQYLQAVFTKEGGTTNYLGFTKNLSEEWYQYKSSPSISDFGGYFYSFMPVNSTWSGQINTRFDINDSGFTGPGNYLLKILKYVTSSSATVSNNSILITVNIPLAKDASSSGTTPTSVTFPKINFELPGSVKLAEEFKVPIKLTGFDKSYEYLVKVRGGLEEGKLTKLQTKNGGSYLSDNESWDKYPKITTDDNGAWNGDMFVQATEDKPTGRYKIQIRIRKKDSDTYIESGILEMDFQTAEENIIPESTKESSATAGVSFKETLAVLKPEATVSSQAIINLEKNSTGDVLAAWDSALVKEARFIEKRPIDYLPIIFIIGGISLLFVAGVYYLYFKNSGL